MSDDLRIDIEGLDALSKKFSTAPKTLQREEKKAMVASLDVLQEKTPGYPPQRENQKTPYRRTGTLARSLGISQSGGKSGKPSIYTITANQSGVEGRYGTNLSYAPYVIGPPDAPKGERQAWMHKGWWWTIDFVARRAKDKIVALWNEFIKRALDA